MPERPPDAETMSAISKGVALLARRSGCPATALVSLVLASDAARAVGLEPLGGRGPEERVKASIRTQAQADAVLALLRAWYRQMGRREKK